MRRRLCVCQSSVALLDNGIIPPTSVWMSLAHLSLILGLPLSGRAALRPSDWLTLSASL